MSKEVTLANAKRVALVLSGGASKGAFQAGVMQALAEDHVEPIIYTGVSVGAINAAIAAEYGLTGVWPFWKEVRKKDIFRSYGIIRSAWRLWRKGAVMEAKPLRNLIQSHIHPENIPNTKIVRVGVTRVHDGQYRIYNHNDPNFKDAILASTAIPATVQPVRIGEHLYYDGGVRNVTPITSAIAAEPDFMVLVGTQPRRSNLGYAPTKLFGSWGLGYIKHAISALLAEGFESDYREFERINDLLKHGAKHPRYRYIPSMAVFPEKGLGSGMDFSEKANQERFNHGYAVMKRAILESRNYA